MEGVVKVWVPRYMRGDGEEKEKDVNVERNVWNDEEVMEDKEDV